MTLPVVDISGEVIPLQDFIMTSQCEVNLEMDVSQGVTLYNAVMGKSDLINVGSFVATTEVCSKLLHAYYQSFAE